MKSGPMKKTPRKLLHLYTNSYTHLKILAQDEPVRRLYLAKGLDRVSLCMNRDHALAERSAASMM